MTEHNHIPGPPAVTTQADPNGARRVVVEGAGVVPTQVLGTPAPESEKGVG